MNRDGDEDGRECPSCQYVHIKETVGSSCVRCGESMFRDHDEIGVAEIDSSPIETIKTLDEEKIDIPANTEELLCRHCRHIIAEADIENGECPFCNENPEGNYVNRLPEIPKNVVFLPPKRRPEHKKTRGSYR